MVAEDGPSPGVSSGISRSALFGITLVIAILAKLALVGVGVFTGYYTLIVLALAIGGGFLIWGVVVRRA